MAAKMLDNAALARLRQWLHSYPRRWQQLGFLSALHFSFWYRPTLVLVVTARHLGLELGRFALPQALWGELKRCLRNPLPRLLTSAPLSTSGDSPMIFSWARGAAVDTDRDCFLGALPREKARRYILFVGESSQPLATMTGLSAAVVKEASRWSAFRYLLTAVQIISRSLRQGCLPPMPAFTHEYLDATILQPQIQEWLATETKPRYVLMAYEQQPWQGLLIRLLRQRWPQVPIVGYVHSTLTNFPSQFMKHDDTPDRLLVHGNACLRLLHEGLGWERTKLHLTTSFRYPRPMLLSESVLFLPYHFAQEEVLLDAIAVALRRAEGPFKPLRVQIHPAFRADQKHQKFAAKIQLLITEHQSRFSADGGILVISIGVTSALLESLESGYAAVGVFTEPELDAYNSELWPELEVEAWSQHCFYYRLRQPEAFFRYPGAGADTDIISCVEEILAKAPLAS